MTEPLRIGIAGLGTVGTGVVKILSDAGADISARCGRGIEIAGVSARSRSKDRGVDLSSATWFDDPCALASSPDIDVFVELMGGSEGPALDAVTRALELGKGVVTANKALIALHGKTLARVASSGERVMPLLFEAAVAGGIPIIKTLKEGLVANRVGGLFGILNGTCNYILTDMEATGRDFEVVLGEAQDKGYAEADPSFDVGGVDAAHKLAILTSLAFGTEVDFDGIYVEGIEAIRANDIAFAAELGYRIKLLGLAHLTETGVRQRVHPCLVPVDRPIASVDGVTNAVVVETDRLGRLVLEGRGAGEEPTASAVIADIADIARGVEAHPFILPAPDLQERPSLQMDDHRSAYYLRATVMDRPGVIAAMTDVLAALGVSIETIIQRGAEEGEAVPVIVVTHVCQESVMKKALQRIAVHDAIVRPPRLIRIETA